ncbi:NADH:flavin oxidoreductase/NADH oxidase family protein [Streptomyces melanosporofaciens]|uniref:2,4-dienoyl-CoA reductase n=1 Tax=Streptomyces melanosporofaciens TaxID=67327 RepID=A0A1H4KER1_STRMJ|nr:NADH:flavin oxidoreductase/NADH oxidase family protein [Streptomyces melanosporofaciens]SEB57029.1 2,4-dienoyl-CoA reductase [Streptomyces melanosporofaciens]
MTSELQIGKRATAPELTSPLRLSSGITLPNRLAKAAMEEQLAGRRSHPDSRLVTLYRTWDAGGVGMMLTGHVMVDRSAVAQPADIVLDATSDLAPFREWAAAARTSSLWMQINHPGRVVRRDTGSRALAPSAVPVDVGPLSKFFPPPTPMTASDIRDTVERFAVTAELADRAGFAGVEIHAAHGYLLAQFLSPLVNKRTDQWGGSLHNRARLLLDVVAAVRARVSPNFGVAVKLNSADFQRGGFDLQDARHVIEWLSDSVDFVELSGGSIESLATAGHPADERTLEREAYFLKLAGELVTDASVPLMLTGGIRRARVAEAVLARGFSLVGVATALAQQPDAPLGWLAGEDGEVPAPRSSLRSKSLRAAAIQASITSQLHDLGRGRSRPTLAPVAALIVDQYRRSRATRRYRQEHSTGQQ